MPQNDPTTPSAFDTATAVSRAEGGALVAELDPGWDVGGGILNGGYLLSVVARAALLDSPHPHPVAVSASYLRAPSPGPATLTVVPGPAGRTLAHSVVTLADAGGPALTANVTTATLGTAEPEYSHPVPDAPSVEECFSVAEHRHLAPPGVQVPGLSLQVDTRLDPATAGWAFGQPSGEPHLRAWMRFADGREPDPLALLTFADALPPTSFAMGDLGWAPTVQLQVLVRALPAPGWCLVEARSSEIAGGWVDEDYRIWDSTGRLVAQSRQLARSPRR
ncbi:thioesterase family protein [Modestobacter versicolor]|uniref:Acyl-coenzyme A thioesterase PaaI-like protein n=1 Tax=Modestobacter versicolor TaxID=429133 RepID=A0A323V8M4_9ACTN|nr:thioesterase family protein [Modestobacter versicolor]MBB3676686.1 acyl-coenzyme A thioesterase PaaI-like protein [Modestobacter versicolor]PZA20393.1 thioesterase family protein [Modestobacter versicolor]